MTRQDYINAILKLLEKADFRQLRLEEQQPCAHEDLNLIARSGCAAVCPAHRDRRPVPVRQGVRVPPRVQAAGRGYYEVLKELGKLPPGIECRI